MQAGCWAVNFKNRRNRPLKTKSNLFLAADSFRNAAGGVSTCVSWAFLIKYWSLPPSWKWSPSRQKNSSSLPLLLFPLSCSKTYSRWADFSCSYFTVQDFLNYIRSHSKFCYMRVLLFIVFTVPERGSSEYLGSDQKSQNQYLAEDHCCILDWNKNVSPKYIKNERALNVT